MTAAERPFCFVHKQKTGGTSVIRRLRCQFDRARIYPSEADGDRIARVISVEHLQRRFAARRNDIRVVTGEGGVHSFEYYTESTNICVKLQGRRRLLIPVSARVSVVDVLDQPASH